MKDNIDYNDVKDNPDIEMGTIFRFENYICEVDDFNQDNPNESIVYIYDSQKAFDDNEYIEQVSLVNNDIKDNIREYMEDNYVVKSVSRIGLLIEIQDQISHDLLSYSKNYLMSEPKSGHEKEWKTTYQKYIVIQEMIKDERIKSIETKKHERNGR